MKMSDLEILASASKQEFINEVGIPIPENKRVLQDLRNSLDDDSAPGDYKIFLRARSEASRGGYTAAQHSCSVKLKIKKSGGLDEYEIPIPTKSYNNEKESYFNELTKFYKILKDNDITNALINFILDNQMAIIAYWYQDSSTTKEAKALLKYLRSKMAYEKYNNKKHIIKDDKTLKDDQEMLIKYVQDETGKSNAVLYFGA